MTREELNALFDKHDEEYLRGDIEGPRDLAAFNRLNQLAPANGDIVAATGHEEFWLSTEPDKLAEVASEDDVIFLIRCGVRLDEGAASFAMFA